MMCERKSLEGMSNRKQMVAIVGWPSFPLVGTGTWTSSLLESVESCVIVAGATDVLVVQLQYCSSSNVKLTRIIIVVEQPLVLSHLILSIMPLPSYQMNYPTLQFDCYGTALYLIFYILLLFGLVDIIISHYFKLLTLKPYPYSAKLYSYSAIFLYILSFTPYLLIFLSSYL